MFHFKFIIMKSIIYLYIGVVFLIFSSCDDFLEKSPSDELSTSTFWTSEENVQAAVTAAYAYLGDEWWTTFLTCAGDDSYAWSTWPSDVLYVTDGSATTSLGTFAHFWNYHYQAVTVSNNILDNIDNVEMDEDTYNQLKSEARFLRAYAYHRLVSLYGDVPLIEHVQTDPNEYLVSRTAKSEVVDFIVSELDDIADLLPESYDDTEYGKITKGAALALEARVLLYNGSYTEAATIAKEVMDEAIYGIDADFVSLFDGSNEQSSEIILSAQYTANYKSSIGTWVGGPFVSNGWSEVVPLQSIVDAFECTDGLTIDKSPLYDANNPFENRDPRLAMTIVLPGSEVNGIVVDVTADGSSYGLGENNASYSGYYYRKYIATEVSGSYDANSTNDIILLRYAEVLLTYAEAKIEAGSIDQTVLDAINAVRAREDVNMPLITTTDQSELRTIVRRERRVEFANEQGRLFDIRRWGIAEDVLDGQIYGILNNFDDTRTDYGEHVLVGTRVFNADRDYLWPVPQSEIDINENLVQNDNW